MISGAALLSLPVSSLSLSPSGRVDFGAQDIGAGASVGQTLLISNHTISAVALVDVFIDGPAADVFHVISDSGETNLLAGGCEA